MGAALHGAFLGLADSSGEPRVSPPTWCHFSVAPLGPPPTTTRRAHATTAYIKQLGGGGRGLLSEEQVCKVMEQFEAPMNLLNR